MSEAQTTFHSEDDRQRLLTGDEDLVSRRLLGDMPEFFFDCAEQYDQSHPDEKMDAIALDISHFSIISSRSISNRNTISVRISLCWTAPRVWSAGIGTG